MNNEKISIEIADNATGLISLEAARQTSERIEKTVRALQDAQKQVIREAIRVERKPLEKELNEDPKFTELLELYKKERSLKQQLQESKGNFFSRSKEKRLRKELQDLFQQAKDLVTIHFIKFIVPANLLWCDDVWDIVERVKFHKFDIDQPEASYASVIELKLLTTKDWEKKSFDELYKLILNG